jgi:hypothetical protein
MYDPEVTHIDQPVTMPLPDGTTLKVSALAKQELTEISASLRVKKAGSYEYVVFAPSAALLEVFGAEEQPTPRRDINLRDFLAFEVYRCAPSFVSSPKNLWRGAVTLANGDPRDLTPENFRLVWHETPYQDSLLAQEADTDRAEAAEAESIAIEAQEEMLLDKEPETPSGTSAEVIENQRQWLGEHFGKLRNVAGRILRERKHQADEVIQKTVTALLSQIANGTCPATEEVKFISWMQGAARAAARWKLGAIHAGVCQDIDHDPAEIRLLKLVRRSTTSNGGEFDLDDAMQLMDESDSEKEERERIQEEGGKWDWNRVDLEAGIEV